MTTGDLKNNLKKLELELRRIHYKNDVDFEGMGAGSAAAYLPIYHYVFTDYSPHVVKVLNEKGIELYGKTDLRFMEAVYKSMRELFSYKPPITRDQFFSPGFIERKVIMAINIITHVREKHASIAPKPAKGKIAPGVLSSKPTGKSLAAGSSTGDGSVNNNTCPRVVNEVRNPDKKSTASMVNSVRPKQAQAPSAQVLHHTGHHSAQHPGHQPQHRRQGDGERPTAPQGRGAESHNSAEAISECHFSNALDVPQQKARVVIVSPGGVQSGAHIDRVDNNVEIINVQRGFVDDGVGCSQRRPIDVISQTPGAGVVRNMRHTDPGAISHAQGAADTGTQHLEAVMTRLQETMESLVVSLSNLECRMSAAERQMYQVAQLQQTGPGEASVPREAEDEPSTGRLTEAQFENLAAKVTLLANRVTLLECQIAGRVPDTPLEGVGGTTTVGPVPAGRMGGAARRMVGAAAGDDISRVPETPTDPAAYASTLPFSPSISATVSGAAATSTDNVAYNSATYRDTELSVQHISEETLEVPSPIPQCARHGPNGAERLKIAAGESPALGINQTPQKATSTPTEAHMATPQALKSHFISQETKDKALHMYNMMAETKLMLNLPMNTPEPAPRPSN